MWQTKWRRGLYSRYREISYPKMGLKLRVAVSSGALLLGICQGVWAQQDKYQFEAIYKDNTVYNVCETLPVFSLPEITVGPSGSPPRSLAFGETVVIKSRIKKYFVPDSHPSSKLRLCRAQTGGSSRGSDEGGCDPPPSSYERYDWFEIKSGGYVPQTCLVHKKWFARQKEKRAASDAVTLLGAKGKAKKKSQDVTQNCAAATDGVVTLLGAKGKAKKKSQGQTCVQGFDDYLKALPRLTIFSDDIEAFLQEGKLGDFAG